MNFARFCELTGHNLTEVARFLWPCYGENAYNFSYWNEDHDGFSINTIVRLDGMIVEVVEVCDYAANRAYRWFNPNTGAREAYIKAAPAHCENYRQAWDDVDFVELDVLDDFIAKAEAIRDGRDYDDRVTMPIDISDEDFVSIARMAHDRDITFNQMVEHILREQIDRVRRETTDAAV